MRVNTAVLFVMLVLVALGGWLVARVASPKALTLLMGVALGVIVSAPASLVVALYLGATTLNREGAAGVLAAGAVGGRLAVRPLRRQVPLVQAEAWPRAARRLAAEYSEVVPLQDDPLEWVQFVGE